MSAVLSTVNGVDAAIVDHYDLGAEWERAIARLGLPVAVIDDLADRPHDCALLLDQNITAMIPGRYDALVPPGCKLLLGPAYALLRPEFDAAKRRERSGGVKRIAVSFGGFDSPNATAVAIEALGRSSLRGVSTDVVLDPRAPHAAQVRQMCSVSDGFASRGRSKIWRHCWRRPTSLGVCGVSQWERTYLGIPTACDDRAESTSRCAYVAQTGIAAHAGAIEDLTPAKLAGTIDAIAGDETLLRESRAHPSR